MNNSVATLIDGMTATLRRQIIPKLADEFARGQAFGLIYMLDSLKLRTSWSVEFLGAQVDALAGLFERLRRLVPEGTAHPPFPDLAAPSPRPTAATLETLRDRGDAAVCDWIAWLDDASATMPAGLADSIGGELRGYITAQLRHELKTSARPMFAEMSRGAEAPR